MLRTLKLGSVLVATTAALGLTIAAPASADGVGAQTVSATAYTGTNFTGTPGVLMDVGDTCTAIPIGISTGNAQSAKNLDASDKALHFYSDDSCTTQIAVVQPSTTNVNFGTAVRYKTL
ncbi:hypothetical protein [Streptomyces lunaelactis]|uniref:hypothetical protein n=1 Tax=Streptomyces lunaelactis TaxID=1535768 RepID=UPI001584D379|nr:hypothetical protein [Streptomyces lunaelactis]NUK27007.1 hypothetical protein [Streptomyces lunaelactis]